MTPEIYTEAQNKLHLMKNALRYADKVNSVWVFGCRVADTCYERIISYQYSVEFILGYQNPLIISKDILQKALEDNLEGIKRAIIYRTAQNFEACKQQATKEAENLFNYAKEDVSMKAIIDGKE